MISYLQEDAVALNLSETEVADVEGFLMEGEAMPKSLPAMIAAVVLHELAQRSQAKAAELRKAKAEAGAVVTLPSAAASTANATKPNNRKKIASWIPSFGFGKKKQ